MAQGRSNPNETAAKAHKAALESAVTHFGSQGRLAKAVGIKQPSIAGAILRGRASKSLAQKIHTATRGAVPKWTLRSDLFKAA